MTKDFTPPGRVGRVESYWCTGVRKADTAIENETKKEKKMKERQKKELSNRGMMRDCHNEHKCEPEPIFLVLCERKCTSRSGIMGSKTEYWMCILLIMSVVSVCVVSV